MIVMIVSHLIRRCVAMSVVAPAAIPARLLIEQTATISAFLLGAARSLLPKAKVKERPTLLQTQTPPSPLLLDTYLRWSGADATRYAGAIPPHMVSARIALPLVSALTAQSPYPLLSVLNQGVRLQIHHPLPSGETLQLQGRLLEASDDGYRARIHSRVEVGTASVPRAITVDAMAAVMLKKRPDADKAGERVTPDYQTVAEWQAGANEGVKFFYMTGDFNPIHTLPAFAKRTRFGGCIMHGYGGFAQIFEAVQRSGITIADIDIRFIKPLPLPSPRLQIQAARTPGADGRYAVRMIDADNNLYHVGSFLPQENAKK